MSDLRIHSSLKELFQRHRLIFWYDPLEEWGTTFEGYEHKDVTRLRVADNEFGTKVRIVRDPKPETKFLIYLPSARPPDAENWLLDLLLQGYEYKADRASLAAQEAGLPPEFRELAEEHAAFFNHAPRVQALKDLLHKEDQAREVRLKMMALLAGTQVEVDALLLQFLGRGGKSELTDPVSECFDPAALTAPFWREVARSFGYSADTPSLKDFAVSLFRAANPMEPEVPLHPHARVFLQRWKDSQAQRASYILWANHMEQELRVKVALEAEGEKASLGDWDTFEIFEKCVIHQLCQAFSKGEAAAKLRAVVQARRFSSFWHGAHEAGYAALEQAVELRELLAAAELSMDSMESGITRYTARWWRIDTAYRLCILNLRRYSQVQLMEQISRWVEKTYVNNFLLPLSDRWSDQLRPLQRWAGGGILSQRRFFETLVRPFLAKGQKVFVIVSDALRYEAAADFAQRIRLANRWTAEVEPMLASLPSYTQLGMASLLPGSQWSVDALTANVTLDGRSATGTPNRSEILNLACGGRGIAVQAEEFLEMNTKTEGRALMKNHEVIYIFHDIIDKTGDKLGTEARTFDAVETAFTELELIMRKVANINGSNMLLTADHGFLFQQDEVQAADATTLPAAEEWTFRNRRFALGRGIRPAPTVKIFTAAELGVEGDWSVAFPVSLGRFPQQGSGKRYVHGGVSLQEVVVPVVKIHKARADDTGRVEVEILHLPAKITTGQFSLGLFQTQPAVAKMLARSLRIALYAKDGSLLSEVKSLTFDSQEAEGRKRETRIQLTLSHAANSYNNQEVEIRLEETVPGTQQSVTYRSESLKLQKPFTQDFDD